MLLWLSNWMMYIRGVSDGRAYIAGNPVRRFANASSLYVPFFIELFISFLVTGRIIFGGTRTLVLNYVVLYRPPVLFLIPTCRAVQFINAVGFVLLYCRTVCRLRYSNTFLFLPSFRFVPVVLVLCPFLSYPDFVLSNVLFCFLYYPVILYFILLSTFYPVFILSTLCPVNWCFIFFFIRSLYKSLFVLTTIGFIHFLFWSFILISSDVYFTIYFPPFSVWLFSPLWFPLTIRSTIRFCLFIL